MEVEVVGVVGAGVMGRGVAQSLAQTGHRVLLLDISKTILDAAKSEIKQSIRLQSMFVRSEETESSDAILQRICLTTRYQLLSDVDFVIENVPEKWETKAEVFGQLDAICSERCILASNTSAIPITRLASLTERPSQVLGMHFMNPVPLKPAVEVVRGAETSEETLETAHRLLARMGKESILVNDSPGFVSNRVLMLMINEATHLVHEGVAPAREVDRIFKTCLGHKMGPLETADLIGLDTILLTLEVLRESLGGKKFEPCPILVRLVDKGHHGRKSGQGFYEYPTAGLRSSR